MTIVGTTYQKILIRLMLRSCILCEVAHDFRADLRTTTTTPTTTTTTTTTTATAAAAAADDDDEIIVLKLIQFNIY
jgi:hypothetical protein